MKLENEILAEDTKRSRSYALGAPRPRPFKTPPGSGENNGGFHAFGRNKLRSPLAVVLEWELNDLSTASQASA